MTVRNTHWERESLGGGKYHHTQYMRAVHYPTDGSFEPITNALVPSGVPAFPVGVAELLQTRFAAQTAGISPIWYFGYGTSMVQLSVVGSNNNVNGQYEEGGSTITYPGILDNADLTITADGDEVKADWALKTGHPDVIQWRLNENAGFDPETLGFGSDFHIGQPMLKKVGESIPLSWVVSQQGQIYFLTCVLPDGDWAGWTLDPTLELQPNAADGKDNSVRTGTPVLNYGIGVSLALSGDAAAPNRPIIEFDCSSIPATATCISATLYLYHDNPGVNTPFTANVYSIAIGNAAWIEGTKNGTLAGAGEPCWNALAANGAGGVTTPWAGSAGLSTSGVDYEAAVLGTFNGNRADPTGTEYSTSLTPARVEGWFGVVNTNYGLLLVEQLGVATGGFCSSDHATAAYRPKLVVEYTLGGGDVFASSILSSGVFS